LFYKKSGQPAANELFAADREIVAAARASNIVSALAFRGFFAYTQVPHHAFGGPLRMTAFKEGKPHNPRNGAVRFDYIATMYRFSG